MLGILDAAPPSQRMQGTPGEGGDPQIGREQTGQKVMLRAPAFWKGSWLKHRQGDNVSTLMQG